jgi:hypothetical protein
VNAQLFRRFSALTGMVKLKTGMFLSVIFCDFIGLFEASVLKIRTETTTFKKGEKFEQVFVASQNDDLKK